ncbi:MAG: RDD family protein [Chloroflexi bacterium]|nr:RDD family protein [Chloroflexota bacterium]
MMTEGTMQGQYAGCVTRLIAWLIDSAIIVVVVLVNYWLTVFLTATFNIDINQCSRPLHWLDAAAIICWGAVIYIAIFSLILGPLYMILMWTLTGQTIGKIFAGVRVVRMNGKRMTFRVSFRRYLGYLVSFIGFGVGFLWILFDNQRRGWHDKIAHTSVVYAWSARQNQYLVDRLTDRFFRDRQKIDEWSEKIEVRTERFEEATEKIIGTSSNKQEDPSLDGEDADTIEKP